MAERVLEVMDLLRGSLVRIDCGVVEDLGGLQLRGIWRVEQLQRVTDIASKGALW